MSVGCSMVIEPASIPSTTKINTHDSTYLQIFRIVIKIKLPNTYHKFTIMITYNPSY